MSRQSRSSSKGVVRGLGFPAPLWMLTGVCGGGRGGFRKDVQFDSRELLLFPVFMSRGKETCASASRGIWTCRASKAKCNGDATKSRQEVKSRRSDPCSGAVWLKASKGAQWVSVAGRKGIAARRDYRVGRKDRCRWSTCEQETIDPWDLKTMVQR